MQTHVHMQIPGSIVQDFSTKNTFKFFMMKLENILVKYYFKGIIRNDCYLGQSFARILIHNAILSINTSTIFGTTKVVG